MYLTLLLSLLVWEWSWRSCTSTVVNWEGAQYYAGGYGYNVEIELKSPSINSHHMGS